LVPRRKKDKRERSRNPVLVSDLTKRELERMKAENGAESFDDVIRGLIEGDDGSGDGSDAAFMSF